MASFGRTRQGPLVQAWLGKAAGASHGHARRGKAWCGRQGSVSPGAAGHGWVRLGRQGLVKTGFSQELTFRSVILRNQACFLLKGLETTEILNLPSDFICYPAGSLKEVDEVSFNGRSVDVGE